MNKIINLMNSKQLYKIIYLIISIYFTLSFSTYFNISSMLGKIMIIWGGYLIVHEILINKLQAYTKLHLILLIFVLINIISILLNVNKSENIKTLIVILLEFFVLFSIDKKNEKVKVYHDITLYSTIFVIISFLGSSISLFAYFFNNIIRVGNYKIVTEGKFSGVFSNGNTLGILAFMSIIISMLLINLIENKQKNFLLFINCIVQLAAMYLTGTRSALLGGIVYIFTAFILHLRKKQYRYLACSVLFISLFACLYILIKKNINLSILLTGRYEIWKEAWKLIKNNILIGIGNSNIVPLLKSTSKLPLLGIEFGGLHNIYLQVLLANGVFALITILVFMICSLVKLYSKLESYNEKDKKLIKSIIPMILSILTINLFESNLVYIVSFIGFTLWIYQGYANNILYYYKRGKYY